MSLNSIPKNRASYGSTLAVVGLVVVVFIAFFRRIPEFGFYGDDPDLFGSLANRNWAAEIDQVWFSLTQWPQGRPLGNGLNLNLIPYAIFHLAGLAGLHAAAFLIVAGNCTLLYRLIAQYHPPVVALGAAGFYGLAPADTVQMSLVYAYNFEIAVLFGILSAQAALRGQRTWSAVALGMGLLMMEPVVMFPLLAPLILSFRRERAWVSWAQRHVVVWASVVLATLVVRRLIGDPWGSERVSEIAASPLATLKSGLTAATTGFLTHFDLVFERLIQPFKEADAGLWLVMLAAGAIAGFVVWVAMRKAGTRGLPAALDELGQTVDESNGWPALRLLAAGCAIMLAVYFCYFRLPWYPANWRTGFLSGVHLVAALGSCLVFSAFVSLLATALPRRFKLAMAVLPVLIFASLTGFGQLVQRDYAKSWTFQRNFWQAYARLCPDATEGTYVLVLDRNLPHPRYIELFSWSSEILPSLLFNHRNLPLTSDTAASDRVHASLLTRPPSVILTASELATAIRHEDGQYVWKATNYYMQPKTPEEQPETGNVIVLVYDSTGTWQRLTGEMAVDGGTLLLRPPGGNDALRRARKLPLAAVYGL